jgi:hypothetical protein
MTSPASPVSSRPIVVTSLLWLAATVLLGVTGAFGRVRSPAPQLIALVLTVVAVVVTTSVPNLRAWIDSISIRALVSIHVIRFIGIVFLILGARGLLSPLFAERAGWGDITAATGALFLVLSGLPRSTRHRWLYLAWNTFGVLDLIVAVSTAAIVVIRGDSPGMEVLSRLPLIIVPVLAVPFLFAAHVAIYRRLLGNRETR